MVKLLHFADFHLGVELYGKTNAQDGINSRIHDFCARLDELVAYATREQADLVIFAGDAFKNRQPNPTIQREFAHRVSDLAARCPVVLLIGNHDMAQSEHRASSIDIYDTLNVPGVLVGSQYDLYDVETPSGKVFVGTAPYPIRQTLLKDSRAQGKSISELDALLLEALIGELDILGKRAENAQPADAPRVLVGHFSVSGAELGSEQGIMIGRDTIVPISALDTPAWDYVALGHIHKHQHLTGGRQGATPVVYAGSMERIDFGEERQPKGFCWVDLERGKTRWKFVPVRSRPFVTLRIDVRGEIDPMPNILAAIHEAELAEAVVRVILRADVESEKLIRDAPIYAALKDSKASVYTLSKEVERSARSRLGDVPEGLTPHELLERYFVSLNYSPEYVEDLLTYAAPFLQGDAEGG